MSRGDAVTRKLVTFGRILREAGLEVGPGRLKDAIQGLDAIDLARRDEVYQALCCTLVSRRDDLPVFDAAFRAFWDRAPVTPGEGVDLGLQLPAAEAPPAVAVQELIEHDDAAAEDEPAIAAAVASPDELLRRRDFAGMTPDELRRLRRLMDDLASLHPLRRSRRLAPAHGAGVLDARRTLRQALRTGGLPLQRSWRRPKLVPRKLVVLCDVSGSMEPYARALIMFLQALAAPDGAARHVEVFAFGTRLHRLTAELAGADAATVLDRAAALLPDWGGGTRIGESLRTYNTRYGRRGMTRGAVVVIASDGWERGDLALLDRELTTVARQAHELIWVNPLKGHEGFEPLAGGMRIALEHVDRLLEGHNLLALEALAEALRANRPPAMRHAV
jgi:uncharacterized protein with von Willebrand factor type A (vWA) domain